MRNLALLVATCSFLGACASDTAPNPGGPPSCTGGGLGGLGCICVTDSCTCSGTTTCNSTCGDECAVTCNGAGGCTAACGVACRAVCNGADPCDFHVGSDSEIVCNGAGGCDALCEGGGCITTCNTTGGCVLRCPPGGECEFLCNAGTVTDCGGGVQACGRSCPST